MDDTTEQPAPVRGAGRRRAIYTAALATGLALGGFGIAAAQTETPDTTPPPAVDGDDAGPERRLAFKGGPGFGMMGGRGAIHGEFVVPDGDGDGYRTAVVQRGTVTAVDGSSVTVRSEDGFSETYTVDDNTLVNAGNDGIGDVEVDDEVHVHGYAADGSGDPHAAHIVDETGLGEIRRHWHPRMADDGAAA